ncbi:uncharacterized protein B0H18DRAFT_886378 [Fomitopsis serialis]|uniref:uncharacterized protein n=1 Tax=Fomitopsis serialis TaxID=139415 RepID=UPI0020087906|nr:uncharacterized protein B0H18DRAFT_886378 [Neoantrodia serialis]KAH9915000.1 hypothetical protein B0H18DRAFT_886378 [Neoantrodia serialis]
MLAQLTASGHALDTVLEILQFMDSKKVNLGVLVSIICWHPEFPALVENAKVQHARTSLTHMPDIKKWIERIYRPPRRHNAGISTEGAHAALRDFAMDVVSQELEQELKALDPIMRSKQDELSEESVLSIKLADMENKVTLAAPKMWRLLRGVSYSAVQEKRNTMKNPNSTVLMMITMICYSRSHHLCRFQQMLSLYFRACGLASVAFNTLNAFSICMNQKWVYPAVDRLATTAHEALRRDIESYLWFGSHDNINRKNKKFEQRLDNQCSFESGTAGTIYIIKNPTVARLDARAVREQLHRGSQEQLSLRDLLLMDAKAAPRILERAVYHVLSVLTEAPDFEFSSYQFADHSVFQPPAPTVQLPTGPEHATVAYMLNTVKIEEASYEGNIRVMQEWERQLGFNTQEKKQKLARDATLVWVGDQLTVSRLRGIQRFRCADMNAYERMDHVVPQYGWFHLVISNLASLHSQYYGTTIGRGLAFAIELLNRRRLSATSVQGLFTHDMSELLDHLGTASLRDAWCKVANVKSLSDLELRNRQPEELRAFAEKIVAEYASTKALELHRAKPKAQHDEQLQQRIQFNRDILDYFDIRDSIKSGDVGALEEQLPRLFIRFLGGKNSNYHTEVLGLMHSMYREWTPELRNHVMQHCWLANTTGRPDSFLPFDQLQEHNIRDLKYIFELMGPYATWELLGRMSAAIPCLRKLKDHIESEFNHYHRGKSHTSPDAEEDIAKLHQALRDSKVHQYIAGRRVTKKNKYPDVMREGSNPVKMKKALDSFYEKRECDRVTTERYVERESTRGTTNTAATTGP